MAKVLVETGVKLKLQQKFSVNPITIRRALNGDTDTKLARLIRAAAINEFGGMVQKQVITNK